MAKKKNNNGELIETLGAEADDDTAGTIPTELEADTDDEDVFDFAGLIPEGVKLVELAPDFVRPEGFLMVPRINKKTGEITPSKATFAGILHDIVPWTDNRGKQRVWFACEATSDIPGTFYTGQEEDKEGKPKDFQKPVLKGTRIGISGSGAINALKAKKGHFIALHWTGEKVPVKNGDMWEIVARVSEKPVIAVSDTKA